MKNLSWFDIILLIMYILVGVGFVAITFIAMFIEKNILASILGISFVLDYIIHIKDMGVWWK